MSTDQLARVEQRLDQLDSHVREVERDMSRIDEAMRSTGERLDRHEEMLDRILAAQAAQNKLIAMGVGGIGVLVFLVEVVLK